MRAEDRSRRFPSAHLRDDEEHFSYDPDVATRFWTALLRADRVLSRFRGGFVGKASPVHFFWGHLDLAVSRLSGRVARGTEAAR